MKTKLLLLVALSSFFAKAQNLFHDDFSSYMAGMDLHGQGPWTHNSSLPGGLGAAVGAIPNNADVIATPVSYLNYGTSSNSVALSADSDGCGVGFTAVTSGDLYVGFVLNLSNAQANNNSDFFRVMSANNLNTTFRLYATNAPGAFFLGVSKGANGNQINFTPNALSYNQDHLIIIKYTQAAGANDDAISLYVDPVYANGEPGVPTISNNVGADQSGSIDRLAFRQNWTNGMPTGNAGLVSVATTWEGLGFIPLATHSFAVGEIIIDSKNAKSGRLTIESTLIINPAQMKIISLNGTLIDDRTIHLEKGANNISINPIATDGVFIVEITDNSGRQFVQKIINR